MKKALFISFIVFFCSIKINAQNNISNISNIKPISKQEFLKIEHPKNGDIVLISEEDALYYYSGTQWYAMKGECYPKPISPKIDSIKLVGKNISIFFDDTNNSYQKYIISYTDNNSEKEIIASKSPAIIDKLEQKKSYYFSIKAKNKCGMAGPINIFTFEY